MVDRCLLLLHMRPQSLVHDRDHAHAPCHDSSWNHCGLESLWGRFRGSGLPRGDHAADKRSLDVLNHSQWFVVEATGVCRWTIRHQVTDELAGTIVRSPAGYVLKDDREYTIGRFATREHAVEGLYEFV